MSSILGAYYAPWHYYPQDEDYLRRLDPAWVRIHQPTAKAIELVQRNAPNARIMLRSWDIDDHNGDRKRELYASPKDAAARHLAMWRAKWEELEAEMRRNGWQADTSRWYIGLVNEPDPAYAAQVVEYTQEAMHLVSGTMIRLGVVFSSVGTFSKPSENDHGWTLFKPLEAPINDGGHILVVHEYWQPEGPSYGEDAGNLAWRHHSIPLDVPILIGESGANGYIYQRHSPTDDAGWRKFMDAETYAAQVQEYIEGCDSRVKGVCLYMLDYHSAQWESFYTGPAAAELLAIKGTRPLAQSPESMFVPIVTTPPPPPPSAVVPVLVHPLESYVRITSLFSAAHPAIDFSVVEGSPVRAVADGQAVEVLNDFDGYGLYVKLAHPWGESLYAHLSVQQVAVGQQVKAGQAIGLSGNTGKSTGPHLHFAIRIHPYNRQDGKNGFSDPMPYLTAGSQPTPATSDIDLMARIITAEARGESILGQLAVAWVIMNRAANPGWWGGNLREVMLKPHQFAKPAATATETATAIAKLAIGGLTVDPTDGSDHFHADHIMPDWATKIEFVKAIGRHRFYRGGL